MKKYLYFFVTAVALSFTSCGDDDCNHTDVPPPPVTYFPMAEGETAATWYDAVSNEEITYDGSGTYYDRYSNMTRSGEIEGHWEYDSSNNKLTYRYSFIGINEQKDWTVKDIHEFDATISSATAAAIRLEKVVEKHTLGVGGTFTLDFDDSHSVSAYTSSNERIASVSSNGTVTATGEKGTAYIKMTGSFGNTWAKVTVGDDRKDLWCDMEPIIGMNYDQMTRHFAQFGQPQIVGDYKDFFGYKLNLHDYIDNICMVVDFINDRVVQVQLQIKEGVPNSEITAYLKSRYYVQPQYSNYYTSLAKEEDSGIIINFDTKGRQVGFFDNAYNQAPMRDFTPMFGKSKTDVREIMDNSNFPFMFSDASFSANGSDYFQSPASGIDKNLSIVAYVYDASDSVAEVWAYKTASASYTTFKNYLKNIYNYSSSESTSSKTVYYNNEKTIRITVDPSCEAVIFTDLTRSIPVPITIDWTYEDALYAKRESVKRVYGNPYEEDGNMLYYASPAKGIKILAFQMSNNVDKCRAISLILDETFGSNDIVKFFGSKFTIFGNGTAADGSQYAWINASSVNDATVGIIYTPGDNMVQYLGLALSSGSNAKVQAMREAMRHR